MADFMRLLQQVHKMAPPLATKSVNIAGVNVDKADRAFVAAKEELQGKIPYNVEKSYDCPWLRDKVLRKISAAKDAGQDTIVLENTCCTLDTCPQLMFMTLFVEQLKK